MDYEDREAIIDEIKKGREAVLDQLKAASDRIEAALVRPLSTPR